MQYYEFFLALMIIVSANIPLLIGIIKKAEEEDIDIFDEIKKNKNGFISGWIYGCIASVLFFTLPIYESITGGLRTDLFIVMTFGISADVIVHKFVNGGKILDRSEKKRVETNPQ